MLFGGKILEHVFKLSAYALCRVPLGFEDVLLISLLVNVSVISLLILHLKIRVGRDVVNTGLTGIAVMLLPCLEQGSIAGRVDE